MSVICTVHLLQPEWHIADPICTFLFSILVLISTLNIMRDAMNVLMEGEVLVLCAVSIVVCVRMWVCVRVR